MKKFLKILVVVLICATFINVKADSGWDTDYDSGGSWSSSDSSRDHDSISGVKHYKEGDGMVFFFFVVIIVSLAFSIAQMIENDRKRNVIDYSDQFDDISEEKLKALLPKESLNDLKLKLFYKFVEIQEAWMNFEYDKLKQLCSNELYNMYKAQLEALMIKNGQNVMDDFNCEEMKIYNIAKINNQIIIKYYLKVAFLDYVIDIDTEEVTRGTNKSYIRNQYLMTFVINTKTVKECPSCGAKISNLKDGKCKYCDSEIINNTKDYVLTSKKNLRTKVVNK